MRIIDIARKLIAVFKRDDLKEAVRLILQRLNEQTIEIYAQIDSTLQTPLRSTFGAEFEKEFKRVVKSRVPGSFMNQIYENLKTAAGLLTRIDSLIDKSLPAEVSSDGITYRAGEIVRLVGYIDFVNTYAEKLAHLLVNAEVNLTTKEYSSGQEMIKPELEYLKKNQTGFLLVMEMLNRGEREILEQISKIPEIEVEDDDRVVVQTVGMARLDPLRSNMIPVVTPMFKAIGFGIATWQDNRYQAAKTRRKLVESRLEQYRRQKSGEPDARLDRIIKHYEDEVRHLTKKVDDYERKYL